MSLGVMLHETDQGWFVVFFWYSTKNCGVAFAQEAQTASQ